MTHLNQKSLMGFLRGDASEQEAESIYEHLVLCSRCDQHYWSLRGLRDHFDGSWQEFLDEWQHLRQVPVLRLVAFIREDPPLALGGMTHEMQRDWVADDLPEHVGVAGSESKQGDETESQAHESLARGDREEAEALLGKLAGQDPERAAFSRRNLRHENESSALLIVDAKRQTVSVLVNTPELGSAVRLVTNTGSCKEIPLTPVSGASYRLAEFEHVDTGWYTIEILEEPLP